MSDSHLSSSHAVKDLQEEKVLRRLSVYAGPVSFECAITTVIQVKSTSWVYKDCLGFLDVKKNMMIIVSPLAYVTQDMGLNLLWGA